MTAKKMKQTDPKIDGNAKQSDPQSKPDAPKRVRAARLDADGTYRGIEELPEEELDPTLHLPEVPECDLPPGEYRWDFGARQFVPIRPRARDQLAPDATRAFALGFAALAAGRPLPAETMRFVEWFRDTVDAKGA